MRTFAYILVVAVLGMFLFQSCDKSEEPYTEVIDTIFPPAANDTVRIVLLEEFTGHTCVNCPEAGQVAHQLADSYKGQVVVVGVHAGYFSNPIAPPFNYNFQTTMGNTWYNDFEIPDTPKGMVNRIKEGNSYAIPFPNWTSKVTTLLENDPEIHLAISNTYNAGTRELQSTIAATFLTPMEGAFNLNVVILEDDIIKPQKNNKPEIGGAIIEDYHHMHVLREAITADKIWGDELVNGSATKYQTINKTYTYSIDDEFVAENCHVVAFVTNAASKEVIQAGIAELIGEE